MSKLLYCAIFIALTAVLACSGPETSQTPTAHPVETPAPEKQHPNPIQLDAMVTGADPTDPSKQCSGCLDNNTRNACRKPAPGSNRPRSLEPAPTCPNYPNAEAFLPIRNRRPRTTADADRRQPGSRGVQSRKKRMHWPDAWVDNADPAELYSY